MEIKKFRNIDEILNEIKNDKEFKDYIKDRFPVRFIFFPNKETFKDFIENVVGENVKFEEIPISHYSEYSTSESIIRFIKSKIRNDKDILVVPVSEIVRFYDSKCFSSLFQQLSEIEFKNNKNKVRIYIPIIGLYSRFEKEFLNYFSRRDEWAPIWKLDNVSSKKITVFCLNIELDHEKVEKLKKHYTIIKTFEDWGYLWKKEEIKDIISLCEDINYLSKYSQPDSFFTFESINTYKEFLQKVLKINIPIEYNDKEKNFWKELTEKIIINDIQSFNDIIEKIFKKIEIVNSDIIELWIKGNAFQRWLLKQHVLIDKKWENTYLYKVLKDIDKYDDLLSFEQSLWLKIFEIEPPRKEHFNERRELIKIFYDKLSKEPTKDIEIMLKEKLSKLSDITLKQKIMYLTDTTQFEKEQIILYIIQALKNGELTKDEVLDLLGEIYSNLYYYLDTTTNCFNIDKENEWIIEYFNEYRWSKVLDKPSAKLLNLLNEKNRNKDSFAQWYWKFKLHKDILAQIEKGGSTKIVWIDGLGVEFIPLIKNIVNNYENYFIKNIFIGRAELPSITKFNKFECDEKINDLDEYIHKQNPYKHPKCIVEEIDIVNNIIKKILDLGFYDKIIIVSDHGFTPFAMKKYGNALRYENFKAEHEGRYVNLETLDKNIKDNIKDNEDFIKDPNDRALVALRYTSLGSIPKREVHGGATPEEVLVPIIVISRDINKISYEISYEKTILLRNPILYLDIIPNPIHKPHIIFGNHKLELDYDDSNKKWYINLPIKKPGKYLLKIIIGNNFKKDIEIEIKSGLIERDIL
ncbi:BREX-4 system phosphatase PglZ [Methanocaldococcus sp.]